MSGPLAGVRVLELAGIGPGPFAAMLLADLGADVVRIDRPEPGALSAGDPGRDLLNRGKRSVVVDLKHPDGAEVVLGLAERAAIVIEGWRPGVAERLGIGPQVALERNPGLVYGRMTGWGQQGPLARAAGHDIGYIAVAGALHPIGRPDGPPQIPLNLVGDFGGGALYLVVGCLAALHVAGTTGRGQVVDAAIVDGTAHLTTMFAGLLADGAWRPERGRNLLDGGAPFYDVYATADGGHMAVGALEPRFYAELLRLLGLADADLPAQHDVAGWPVLRARFAEVFAGRTRDEWTTVFEGTDACVAPVLSLAEAQHHPHLVARATFEEHFGLRQPAVAPRLSRTPGVIGGSPPVPGADTETVLTEWGLGAHLRQWLDNGAVSQTQGAR
ncbi:CaiB/BaiF CoA-transferase family protein [Micromonospora sp. NBRC 101691]|uniref:CaiB/BaiF CoA transferase family protein n=1 Tax=Micromonospora sp. NBRC 101691 TaxID=3032198 RepID=UPI0024A34E70|nr:CaiB/BaiF CoA-transferase family protein [Micromonospora sp. NBRC 101691]GLY24706.1 CoA transferase [Micromonospora sp. NBRC 101691]